MDNKDIIMTIAVVLGPIIAVLITRWLDNRRFAMERKLSIFRALMKDRRNQTSYDFVTALNLIEIDFHKEKKVMAAWQKLHESLSSQRPHVDDKDGWDRKFQEWNNNTTRLLCEIGRTLGISKEQIDIQSGGYMPEAWGNERQQRDYLQKLLIELLENKRGLLMERRMIQPQVSREVKSENKNNT